jgi:transcriptional regulator GlxA family with amidase domain
MRVAILAIPGVQLLDVAGPLDVFCEANKHLGPENAYSVEVVALTQNPVVAQNGLRLIPDLCIRSAVERFDTILVAGSPSVRDYEDNKELVAWIMDHAKHVRRLGSVCTGAFLLAHAGLLNDRWATTHWNSTSRLGEMFPQIKVDANRIYIKDGPIYTTAGVTASLDLTLALVEEDHGRGMALRVAKELILFLKRPGGQAQFSMHLAAQISDCSALGDLRAWIVTNLSRELSVDSMAKQIDMSTRNFARIFKRETGMTPGEYVEMARIEEARRLLEDGDTHLKQVAQVCGFGDRGSLRRAFLRRFNITPVEYRNRFRPAKPIGS